MFGACICLARRGAIDVPRCRGWTTTARTNIASANCELARIEARKSKLINLVLDDQLPALEAKEELLKNAKRREELEAQLRVGDEPPPLLHPRMADVYRRKVEELAEALQRPDARVEASETPVKRKRATTSAVAL